MNRSDQTLESSVFESSHRMYVFRPVFDGPKSSVCNQLYIWYPYKVSHLSTWVRNKVFSSEFLTSELDAPTAHKK